MKTAFIVTPRESIVYGKHVFQLQPDCAGSFCNKTWLLLLHTEQLHGSHTTRVLIESHMLTGRYGWTVIDKGCKVSKQMHPDCTLKACVGSALRQAFKMAKERIY